MRRYGLLKVEIVLNVYYFNVAYFAIVIENIWK